MEPFKNWLGIQAARRIAKALKQSHASFRESDFLQGLEAELEPLSLKERMHEIKRRIVEQWPKQPKEGFPLLVQALKTSPKDTQGLSGFEVWPLTQIVAEIGQSDFAVSMKALHAMTQVFSAEFAVRPFLLHQEVKTLKQFMEWTEDPSEHVRRLTSEGSRPFLPWGEKIPAFAKDPSKTWPILEKLRRDSSHYVAKSVANHINDHTKNHPEWVLRKLRPWKDSARANDRVSWMIRHGTRTLIKKGHPQALELQGIAANALRLKSWNISPRRIRLGESLTIEATLSNPLQETVNALIDIDLGLRGANGQTRSKIFKGTQRTMAAGENQTLTLRLPLRRVTTRRYYPGTQSCRLLVNGTLSEPLFFDLRI